MNEIFSGTFNWIREDYKSNQFRFCLEVLAWGISIGCAITMAVTVVRHVYVLQAFCKMR